MKSKSRQGQQGIRFHNTISISSTERARPDIKLLIFQFLLIFGGVVSTLFCLIESLNLRLNYQYFILGSVCFSLYFFILLHVIWQQKLFLLFSILLFCIVLFLFRQEILNGFFYVEASYLEILNRYMGMNLFGPKPELSEVKSVTIFFLALSFLFHLLFSTAVIRGSFRALYLILSLVLVSLIFIIGILPPAIPLFFYMIHLIVFYSMELVPFRISKKPFTELEQKEKINQGIKQMIRLKVGSFCALLLLSIFLLLFFFLSPREYEANIKDKIKPIKQGIQEELMRFSSETIWANIEDFLYRFQVGSGDFFGFSWDRKEGKALAGGALSKKGKVVFDESVVLEAIGPSIGQTFYLKGYAGSEYTGEKWETLTDEEEEEYNKVKSLGSSAFTQHLYLVNFFRNGTLKIDQEEQAAFGAYPLVWILQYQAESKGANKKYFYSPYPCIPKNISTWDHTEGDLYIKPEQQNGISASGFFQVSDEFVGYIERNFDQIVQDFDFNQTDEAMEFESYVKFEQQYREFVQETYTRFPEEGLDQLKSLHLSAGDSVFSKAEAVIKYLSEQTVYTLEPGELPEDKDFIEYFLFENKKGYCAHYASAAVFLLRNMGVPARYAEGYLLRNQDDTKKNGEKETTYQYYANGEEKEVFLPSVVTEVKDSDAHAWVEVYVNGYGWFPIEVTKGYSDTDFFESFKEREPDKDDIITPTPSISLTPKPTNTQAPPATPSMQPSELSEDAASGLQKYAKWIRYFLTFIIVICMIFIILWIRRHLILRKRRKTMTLPLNGQKIERMYLEIEHILKYLGYWHSSKENDEMFAKRVTESILKLYGADSIHSFEVIMEIVLKARFSNVESSKEEVQIISAFNNGLREAVLENSKKWKRYYLYWLYIL